MRCPWTSRGGEAKLVAFVAGKVRGPEGSRLRVHLDDCVRCSEYVAGQKAIWQLMDEWEPEFPLGRVQRELWKRSGGEGSESSPRTVVREERPLGDGTDRAAVTCCDSNHGDSRDRFLCKGPVRGNTEELLSSQNRGSCAPDYFSGGG